MGMEIKLLSLHHITEEGASIRKNVDVNNGKEYMLNLISNIKKSPETREYQIISDTKEVVNIILKICNCIYTYEEAAADKPEGDNPQLTINNLLDRISLRLIESQFKTSRKHSGINHPKKGNLIQAFIEDENEFQFMISLIDSKKFIDENDLKYKSGMLEGEQNTLKSAYFAIDKNNYFVKNIFLSCSKDSAISQYWYDEFLELQEVRSDKKNTSTAYNSISTILSNKLSRKYNSDFLELKNALNVYFLHNDTFSYSDCINSLIDGYVPINDSLNKNELKMSLDECRNKGLFDCKFCINNDDIRNKLVNAKYKVNSKIELKIKTPPEKMKDYLYTKKMNDGELVIVLRNIDESMLKKFNFDNIDLD